MPLFAQTSQAATLKSLPKKLISPAWTIILAQEERSIFSGLTRRFYVDGHPTPLAAIIGTRSMLQHTYEVARRISASDRILIVLTEAQKQWAMMQLPEVSIRNFLILPYDQGTGPAVCLATAFIMRKDPLASVLILRSDRSAFVPNEFAQNFRNLLSTIDHTNIFKPVLIGVKPRSRQEGSNWILLKRREKISNGWSFFNVKRLFRNPDPLTAKALFERGALCNTSVVVAKARAIWYLLWKHLPEPARHTDLAYLQLVNDVGEGDFEETVRELDSFQFESKVLDCSLPEILAVPLEGIKWIDSTVSDGLSEATA